MPDLQPPTSDWRAKTPLSTRWRNDASEASEGWMRPVAGDAAPADPPPTTEHDDLLAQLSQFRVHFNERNLDTGEHRREVHCDFEPPR